MAEELDDNLVGPCHDERPKRHRRPPARVMDLVVGVSVRNAVVTAVGATVGCGGTPERSEPRQRQTLRGAG